MATSSLSRLTASLVCEELGVARLVRLRCLIRSLDRRHRFGRAVCGRRCARAHRRSRHDRVGHRAQGAFLSCRILLCSAASLCHSLLVCVCHRVQAMKVTSEICIYTNGNFTVEKLESSVKPVRSLEVALRCCHPFLSAIAHTWCVFCSHRLRTASRAMAPSGTVQSMRKMPFAPPCV